LDDVKVIEGVRLVSRERAMEIIHEHDLVTTF
jgi:hypothetical protein